VKSERLQILQGLIGRRQSAFNQARLGELTEVLFERRGRHRGQIVGRSPWLLPVQVEADEALIGSVGRVEITDTAPNSLFGRLVDAAPTRRFAAGAIA
jgi:tRNA-2-methylthio-N6-dimethylallyladenosine synthase